jgi:hypothetical protein
MPAKKPAGKELTAAEKRVIAWIGMVVVPSVIGLVCTFLLYAALQELEHDFAHIYYCNGGRSLPKPNEIVLIGSEICVSLNQTTLEGVHQIENIDVRLNGHRVADVHASSYYQTQLIPGNTLSSQGVIKFKGAVPISKTRVGEIDFIVPPGELPGQIADVSYLLNFRYPEINGPSTFVWRSKVMSGASSFEIASTAVRLRHLILGWVYPIIGILAAAVSFVLFYRRNKNYLSMPTR